MFTNSLNGQNAPAKLYPLLALYHLLPLHFPITTWGFDVPWGRFSTPSKLNLNGMLIYRHGCGSSDRRQYSMVCHGDCIPSDILVDSTKPLTPIYGRPSKDHGRKPHLLLS